MIGAEAVYAGGFHRWLVGERVRIVAVHRGPNPDEREVLTDARDVGELQAGDVVEIQPWIAAEGRFSFVTSDADPEELVIGRLFVVDGDEENPGGILELYPDGGADPEVLALRVGETVTVGGGAAALAEIRRTA